MTEMTSLTSWRPSAAQIASYEQNGYLIVPGLFDEGELCRLDRAILRLAKRPGCNSTDGRSRYPQPSKYTISHEGLLDPDLAFLADHPVMLGAAEAADYRDSVKSHAPALGTRWRMPSSCAMAMNRNGPRNMRMKRSSP